ncbi:MAG: transcriptional regulator [Solirubrobacterales bacterium]
MADERTVAFPAGKLLAELAVELEDVEARIRNHRFIELISAGSIPKERLAALAGEQYNVLASDSRSFQRLAERFPNPPAGDFFESMSGGEGIAAGHLLNFAAWTGESEDDLRAFEPTPVAQSYPAFVAWLAINGSRSDVVLAFLANLAAWGENCGRVGAALRSEYGAGEAETAFFDFFANPPADFEERALVVLEAGLAAGDSPSDARRAARMLQAYELSFWDGMAEGL